MASKLEWHHGWRWGVACVPHKEEALPMRDKTNSGLDVDRSATQVDGGDQIGHTIAVDLLLTPGSVQDAFQAREVLARCFRVSMYAAHR